MRSHLLRFAALLCGFFLFASIAPAAADAAPRKFDIPADLAARSLKTFSAQAGLEVLIAADLGREVRTQAVRGELAPREALGRMLAGTGLEVVASDRSGALAVARAKAEPPAPNAPRAAPTPAAARPATKPAAADETLVLSPFTVVTDKDRGYQATTTLAGTRLRTELRDVGTTISVVTPEFLQDTGATNTRGFLTYVTGSEVSGPSGNFLGGGIGLNASENLQSPSGVTRLRGLAAATEARGFYNTAIPLDAYNIDRVEINRGANAILFGTGSPAGIINSAPKQAQMKNAYAFEARYGSYESYRGSFDLNQQLVRGELALRVAGLAKRQKFQQDFAFEDDERLYGALTYDLKWARTKSGFLSGTALRANAERGHLDSRRPKTLPPSDQVSAWFSPWFGAYAPKPTWDAGRQRTTSTDFPGGQTFATTTAIQTSNSVFRGPVVWFDRPGSGAPGTGSTARGAAIVGRQGVISNLPSPGIPLGVAFFASAPDITYTAPRVPNLLDSGSYTRPTLTDMSVFDSRNRLLEGPNRFEYADFEAYNVALEQRLLNDRLGFELAFDRQNYSQGASGLIDSGRSTEIRIDINTTLLDGTPNPNYGRPFVSNFWQNSYSRNEARTGRGTVYYKLDFAELTSARLARWLGQLTFTGLHEEAKSRAKTLGGQRFSAPGFAFGNNDLITDANGGQLSQISYVGPSLASATTVRGAQIPGLTALQLPSAASGGTFNFRGQTATSAFANSTLNIIDDGLIPNRFATSAGKTGLNARAQAAIVQGKALHDTLVLTAGWRRDRVDSFTAAAPARGPRNNLIVDDAAWVFPSLPALSVSDETRSRSAVLHVPGKWVRRVPFVSALSLRYNTSENFSPGSPRFDSNGAVVSSPKGTTKDVGFSLGLLDDRVVLTATWYTTKQQNLSAGGNTQTIVDTWRLFTNITGLGQNPNSAQIIAPPQALLDLYSFRVTNNTGSFVPRPDIVLTADAVSQGAEFEANVNLTRNWRLVANAARQSSTRSNTGAAFRELFFERRLAGGQTLFENWTGPAGQSVKVSEGGELLSQRAASAIVNPYNLLALQDGGPAQELRKWRANVVTHYTFARDGRLKGFGLGSGARWQDKVAIGFPYIAAQGVRVPDVRRPFLGPAEWAVDSWVRYERRILRDKVKLTVQLNAFNVLNDDALIPVGTQPTGEIAVWRIPAERRYELTTRFEF